MAVDSTVWSGPGLDPKLAYNTPGMAIETVSATSWKSQKIQMTALIRILRENHPDCLVEHQMTTPIVGDLPCAATGVYKDQGAKTAAGYPA